MDHLTAGREAHRLLLEGASLEDALTTLLMNAAGILRTRWIVGPNPRLERIANGR
jgi:hypothetical protein